MMSTPFGVLCVAMAIAYCVASVSFISSSGWHRCNTGVCGISISHRHMHDALWHIAIAETAFNSVPFKHPIFAGATFSGYNYAFDALLYLLSKIGIAPLHAYFHILPICIALLYIGAASFTVRSTYPNKVTQLSVAFFLLLGNSAAFLMTLASGDGLTGSATRGFPLVLSIQPVLMFSNLQFALSLCVFLALLTLVHRGSLQDMRTRWIIICTIALLFALKLYAGLMAGLYLCIFLTLLFINRKIAFRLLAWYLVMLAVAVATVGIGMYGAGSGQIGGVFVWDPLAYIRSLIDDPRHFFDMRIALARSYLEAQGGFSPRLVALYIAGIAGFVIINFGTRLIAVLRIPLLLVRGVEDSPRAHDLALWVCICISVIIPLLYVQRGDWFNTLQFTYYGVFLMSFPAGEMLSALIKRRWWWVCIVVLVVNLIPYGDLMLTVKESQLVLPQSFLNTARILGSLPEGVVLPVGMVPLDSRIPAFTAKQVWFADPAVVRNTNVPRDQITYRASLIQDPISVIHKEQDIRYLFADTSRYDTALFDDAVDPIPFVRISQEGPYELWQRVSSTPRVTPP